MILLDNNILIRMSDQKSPLYTTTRNSVFQYRKVDTLVIVPQTLFDFWAVATRSTAVNGLGMDTPRAAGWLKRFRSLFQLLPDTADLLDRWQSLIQAHQIKGFQAHDARYVAAMQCYGITKLMTYNSQHFMRFNVTLITP